MKKEEYTGLEVAVIGIALKFPGANNTQQFWENLKQGRESIKFLTDEDLRSAGVDSSLITNPKYVKSAGGVIEDKQYFDASFFGYTPDEAILMDPQTRIFHEITWQAIEDSGYSVDRYDGRIGLFAGSSNSFHWEAMTELSGASKDMGRFAAAQLSSKDFMTTKVSYKLNLKGPSFPVQTACSTSLVAVHLATRSLLLGECDMAVAGGATIFPYDERGYLYQEGMILSNDGHCRSFDANASGASSGNGAGVVVLKLLKKAIADKDHIYAVIKGSAINNDGNRKTGYTAPSVKGQVEVIRAALNFARIKPESIQYLECHGTATELGDPIEIEALRQAFHGNSSQPCGIGSVKSNIGHLDSAAGIAGLIKTVLCLKHAEFVPSINYENPNPRINFRDSPFYVNTESKPWPLQAIPRRAGVSSFGIGGTNAHVIVEEAPPFTESTSSKKYHLIPLSAKTEFSLQEIKTAMAAFLQGSKDLQLADISCTLATGRGIFPYKTFFVADESQEFVRKLSAGEVSFKSARTDGSKPAVIFLFPGGGAQYRDMAKGLYNTEMIFKASVDEGMQYLQQLTGYNYLDFLYTREDSVAVDMEDTETALPLLFIIEYAMARQLTHWGIHPDAMIGHSLGEYVAACLSGVFSYADALKIVLTRGRLMKQTQRGHMLSVPVGLQQLNGWKQDGVCLAAINSPQNVVLSGDQHAIICLKEKLASEGIDAKIIPIAVASHSAMMDSILGEFEKILAEIDFKKPGKLYLSNVTGTWATPDQSNAAYWINHIRNTVNFSDCVKSVFEKHQDCVFIEVGPSNILSNLVKQHTAGGTVSTVNTIRHANENIADDYYIQDKIGELWLYGCTVDWNVFTNSAQRNKVSLPAYVFDRQRYWIDKSLEELSLSAGGKLIKNKKIADWFYHPTWLRSPNSFITPVTEKKRILLIDLMSTMRAELASALEEKGLRVCTISTGTDAQRDGDHYTIPDTTDNHYRTIFEDLAQRGCFPDTIVFIVTDNKQRNVLDRVDLQNSIEAGFFSILNLVKALGACTTESVDFEVVTNRLYDVTGSEAVNVSLATVLGAVIVTSQENRLIQSRNVDIDISLDNPIDANAIRDLVNELLSGRRDTVVALRNDKRWSRYFEKISGSDSPVRQVFRKGGTYLITGGLGRIGFTLADYLAKTYHANLIITGKTSLPSSENLDGLKSSEDITSKTGKLQHLRRYGSTIIYNNLDICDEAQTMTMMQQAVVQFGRIDGIIHAAAVTSDEYFVPISDIDRGTCEKHFQSKVYGLSSLANVLRGMDYDFCLLMSSISSTLGGLGFSAYAAANAFMDQFAQYESKICNKHWISVGWDGWEYLEDRLKGISVQDNFLRMTVEEGPLAVETILQSGIRGVAVHSLSDLDTRLSLWVTPAGDDTDVEKKAVAIYSRPNILTAYHAPVNLREEVLQEIWQGFFKYNKIGTHDNFFELGGNSLKGVSLIAQIQKKLNVQIPIKEFFARGTIASLAEYIIKSKEKKYRAIPTAEKREYYPLSSAQLRLYLVQEISHESIGYNETYSFEIHGSLKKDRLEEAFRKIIARHEVLRTMICLHNNVPVQKIAEHVDFTIHDVRSSEARIEKDLADFIKPFNLSNAPYFRCAVFQVEQEHHIFLLDLHHIITDGISVNILMKELAEYYAGKDIDPVSIQYKDYTTWQKNKRKATLFQEQKEFWLREFEGDIPELQLPTNFARPAVRSFEGAHFPFAVKEKTIEKLYALVIEKEISLYGILLTAYNVLLSRLSNQNDVIVGTPTSGRNAAELENMLGIFVNTVVIRNKIDDNLSFDQLLKKVNEKVLLAFQHQDYQYEELVDDLKIPRDPSRNPIFDVVFTFQNMEASEFDVSEIVVTPCERSNPATKFDLILAVEDQKQTLNFSFNYSTALFKRETIKDFACYFERILDFIVEHPEEPVRTIELLSDADKETLIGSLNGPEATWPETADVVSMFREQVRKHGHRTAVAYEGISLSYLELDEKSDAIAHALQTRNVPANSIIGLYLDPSIEVVSSILGIIKAGCAYLPIDVNYPKERVTYILRDSRAAFIITTSAVLKDIEPSCAALFLDQFSNTSSTGISFQPPAVSPDQLLYVIYTSGTAGNPKGVMIEHKNVIRLLFNSRFQFEFSHRDVWTLYHSHAFDFSVWEMYGALLYGGKLVIVSKATAKDSVAFVQLLEEEKVTVLNQTPTAFYNLSAEASRQQRALVLRYVIFGGEALSPGKLAKWYTQYPATKLVNMYGITETTVHVTYKEITHEEITANISNIGKPIPTLTTYILDTHQKLQPVGVPGELVVGGAGVARGYLNRQELTAAKFIPSPFKVDEMLYRSGDLARMLENGEMEYLGRMDHQVKIRGYRIELGEIENQLVGIQGITEAVVIPVENSSGEKSLCAYFVAVSTVTIQEIRSLLSAKLPDYMVPAFLMQVDALPMTVHGKINKAALPKPGHDNAAVQSVRPRNAVEAQLAAIWRSTLELDNVSINNNFFHIGGDSIKAIRLINNINNHFKSEIRIADLYVNETIEKLSNKIATASTTRVYALREAEVLETFEKLKERALGKMDDPSNVEDIYPMTEIELGMVFSYLKNLGSGVYHDQFLFNLSFNDFDYNLFCKALQLLVDKHAILRSAFNIDDGDFVQVVLKTIDLPVRLEDYSACSLVEYKEIVKSLLAADIKDVFQSGGAPLWRMKLLQYGAEDFTLVLIFHHAILDGWSVASLMTELNNTYYLLRENPGYLPEKLKSSYKDAAVSEHIEKNSTEAIGFWRDELAGYQRMELSFVSSYDKTGDMVIYKRRLPANQLQDLYGVVGNFNSSLKNILFAAYLYTLRIFSSGEEIIAGWVSNNRPLKDDGDKILGCFLNTIPVRVKIPTDVTYGEYIEFIDRKILSLRNYERVPLFEIAKAIGEKSKDSNPIFDTLFNFVNFHIYETVQVVEKMEVDARSESFSDGNQNTNTLFDFEVSVTQGELVLLPKYDTRIISPEFVSKFCDCYCNLLTKFIDAPDERISANAIIPKSERHRILHEFNASEASYRRNVTLHSIFENSAGKWKNRVAIEYHGQRISYEELNERANRLAYSLRERGVLPGVMAGLIIERSVEMIVGMLAILKVGGAYVPIEPNLPNARIVYILKNLGIMEVLTNQRIVSRILDIAEQDTSVKSIFCLDGKPTEVPANHGSVTIITANEIDVCPSANLEISIPSDNLAYVIFTSGSTGTPKGVAVRHKPVINILEWVNNTFAVSHTDKLLFITSMGFDLSVYDIFGMLGAGGTIHLMGYNDLADPKNILDTIIDAGITVWDSAPAAVQLIVPLLDHIEKSKHKSRLRLIMLSGDWIPVTLPDILRSTFENAEVVSLGGATEATIWSNYYRIGTVENNWKSIPYGKPTQNCKYYVLNDNLEVCPIGIAGDLYIGGECLSSGYINDLNLTAEKFIPNPFIQGELVYKTGDLARWFTDGNMEFLGRKDGQVKIRGFRIETGEIESILLKHDAVQNAIVIAHAGKQKDKYLCAYVVLKNDEAGITDANLKKYLSGHVPDYMIPEHIIFLPEIPVTVIGKVDRKRLHEPEVSAHVSFVAPVTPIENKLCEIWSSVLDVTQPISVIADFFDLGGHSLNVTMLVSHIQKSFNIEISIRDIFANTTIKAQASLIEIISPYILEEMLSDEERDRITI